MFIYLKRFAGLSYYDGHIEVLRWSRIDFRTRLDGRFVIAIIGSENDDIRSGRRIFTIQFFFRFQLIQSLIGYFKIFGIATLESIVIS